MSKWVVKQCPYLESAHVGNGTGIRMDWDGELTFVDRRIVDLCLYCPFWDEKTLTGECVCDGERHKNLYNKGVMPLSVTSKV